jgi:methylmalonyl-CoA mutase cobalamin-binding subunit
MVDLVMRFCDEEPVHYLTESLRYLAEAADIPIPRAFDSILAESMRRVGRQWEEGSRTVAMEHRFTQKVLDALHAFRATVPSRARPDAPLALIGCAETCQHEIGAMFCRVALEMDGWRVIYLGANVPFEEFGAIQAHLKADLVCISFIPPVGNADARRCVKLLSGMYRPETPYCLAFGGGVLNGNDIESGIWPFKAFKVHHTTEGFLRWANAKAGPAAGAPPKTLAAA